MPSVPSCSKFKTSLKIKSIKEMSFRSQCHLNKILNAPHLSVNNLAVLNLE